MISIAQRTSRAVGIAWDSFGGLDDAARSAFIDAAAPYVAAARAEVAAVTDAYLAQVAGTSPVGVDVGEIAYRGGVDIAEVYARPTVTARTAIARGASFAEAITQGRGRAVQLADTDVMTTARTVADAVMRQIPRVKGYRRVPDASACEFCLVASTQRYHVGSLMPIHPGCHCGIAPIVGTTDPGRILDRAAHAQLKADGAIDRISSAKAVARGQRTVDGYREKAAEWRTAAAEAKDPTTAKRYHARAADWDRDADAREARLAKDKAQLKLIRAADPKSIEVHEHGELGPVLYPAGQRFTTAV